MNADPIEIAQEVKGRRAFLLDFGGGIGGTLLVDARLLSPAVGDVLVSIGFRSEGVFGLPEEAAVSTRRKSVKRIGPVVSRLLHTPPLGGLRVFHETPPNHD